MYKRQAYELERQESRMIMDGKAPDEIQREITREREKLAAEMNALAKEFLTFSRYLPLNFIRCFSIHNHTALLTLQDVYKRQM